MVFCDLKFLMTINRFKGPRYTIFVYSSVCMYVKLYQLGLNFVIANKYMFYEVVAVNK